MTGISKEANVIKEENLIENDGVTEIPLDNSNSTLESGMASEPSVNGEKNDTDQMQNKIVEENELLRKLEASSRGKIKGPLIINYLKSANRPGPLVFLVISFLLSQILASVADIWVSYW